MSLYWMVPAYAADGVPALQFTVKAVIESRVVVQGSVNLLITGDRLYAADTGNVGQVTIIKGDLAVVEFPGAPNLRVGEIISTFPPQDTPKQVEARALLKGAEPTQPTQVETTIANAPLNTLHYFVPATHFDVQMTFASPFNDLSSLKDLSGTTFNNQSTTAESGDIDVEYGLSNHFAILIDQGYLFNKVTSTGIPSSGTATDSKSYGPADPIFGAKYQVTLEKDPDLLGHFALLFSPSTVGAKISNSGYDGSNGRGALSVEAIADMIGGTIRDEWLFEISGLYTGPGSVTASTDAASYDFNRVLQFGAAGKYRFHASQNFYFEPSAGFILSGEQDLAYLGGTGKTESINPPPVALIQFLVGYRFSAGCLLAVSVNNFSYTADDVIVQNGSSNILKKDVTRTLFQATLGLEF